MKYLRLRTFYGALFYLLLVFGVALASPVDSHDVVVDINDDDVAHFEVSLRFVELNTEKVNYLVFGRIGNVEVSDSEGPMGCTFTKETYGTLISCIPNIDDNFNYSVDLSFDAFDMVSLSDGFELFTYSYGIKDPTSVFNFKVLLPEGASLLDDSQFDPFFPQGAVIGTEKGRRISLEWSIRNPELGRTYAYNAYFEYVGKSPDSSDGFSLSGGYFVVIIVVLVVVVAGVLLYKSGYGKRASRTTSVKRVISVLKDDERKVVDVIMKKGDKCKQRDIVHETDFSKAKVSRIMTELEMRGIITRKRIGRTNRIVLNDDIDKSDKHKNEKKE